MSTNADAPTSEPGGIEIPAEHIVSPQMRRRLQQCYEHGQRLIAQEKCDFDYANTMFTECIVRDPSNLVYAEAFLDNLQTKYKNNKRGGRLLGLGGGGSRSEFKKAAGRQNWIDVLRLGPELLKFNPWDVTTLRAMAQACEAFRYNEVELRYLKNALDANPKDLEVNRHCARSLARMGQFDQAIACWHRIEELRPSDAEAPKMISELTVERNRAHAGFGGQPRRTAGASSSTAQRETAGKSSDKKTPADKPTAGENQPAAAETPSPQETRAASEEAQESRRREIQLTPIQRLERGISDEPEIVENYLDLIDLYVAEYRFSDAERVLQRGQSALSGNTEILEKGEDLAILRIKHQLRVAEKRAASENTNEARELVEQIRSNLARLELEIIDARSQRYPEDAGLKHKVGMCLKRMGNYREAAHRFQESRNDEQLYVISTLELGECLQHLRQYVKALHCYQRAAEKSADDAQQRDIHLLSLYRAGVLATGLKEWDIAQRNLQELAALDPAYKDVQKRLDKLGEIGDKG